MELTDCRFCFRANIHVYSGITHVLTSNTTGWSYSRLERKTGLEPATSTLARLHTTSCTTSAKLQAANVLSKPHLRTRTLFMVLTYQLLKVEADTVWSCLRDPSITPLEEANCLCSPNTLSRSALAGRDSNPRTRMGADLQSAAFSHFATYQYICAAGRIRTYLLLESNTKI